MNTFGQSIIDYVMGNIYGRVCYEHSNCNYLAEAVYKAGHGDHLEIGTLHGGTAIIAALIKQAFQYDGLIWCVDPLDGYYVGTVYEYPVDPISQVPVTPQVLHDNIKLFRLEDRIRVVQKPSSPFPYKDLPTEFASAFIDGDHWGTAPSIDWYNIEGMVKSKIVFDNADVDHPAVMEAVKTASDSPRWELLLHEGITAVFGRV